MPFGSGDVLARLSSQWCIYVYEKCAGAMRGGQARKGVASMVSQRILACTVPPLGFFMFSRAGIVVVHASKTVVIYVSHT